MDVLMNQLRQRLVWQKNPDPYGAHEYVPTGNTFGETDIDDFVTPDRQLSLRVLMQKTIYPQDDEPYYEFTEFDDSEIVSYSINEQCGEPGFQIGGTIAASFTLSIDNTQRQYVSADFVNTRCAVAIGVQAPGQTNVDYEPLGVFWISNAHASEQSTTVDITGIDALGRQYNGIFYPLTEDGQYISYSSVRGMIDSVVEAAAKLTEAAYEVIDENGGSDFTQPNIPMYSWTLPHSRNYNSAGGPQYFYQFLNNAPGANMYVACMTGSVTERQLFGWVATAFGCFLAIDRNGDLCFRAYDKTIYDSMPTYAWACAYYITPSIYFDYTPQDAAKFAFATLKAQNYAEEVFRIPDDATPSALDSIELPMSPFMTRDLANSIYALYEKTSNLDKDAVTGTAGLACEGAAVSVVGAPQFKTGCMFDVQDLNGTHHCMYANSMTVTYDGGLTMTLECALPSEATLYSASYNTHTALIEQVQTSFYGKAKSAPPPGTEVPTGEMWINEKPLFRMIYELSSTGTTDISDLNFDFIAITQVTFSYTVGSGSTVYWCTSFYLSSTSYAVAYINGTNLIINLGSQLHLRTAWITVEYTKASA